MGVTSSLAYVWLIEYLDDGPLWTNSSSTRDFKRILDHLLEIDYDHRHVELVDHYFDTVMTYKPNNGILMSILPKELSITSSL